MRRDIVALALFLFAACGGSDSTGKDITAATVPPACHVAFTVSVRSGPSAPLDMTGELEYVLDKNGHLSGVFAPTGSENDATKYLRVSGTAASGTITLQINKRDGSSKVIGTGPFVGDAAACTASTMITGTLTGPLSGDAGDWAGRNNGVDQVRDGLVPYVCFALCSYGGGSDAQCISQCTVNGIAPCTFFC